MNRMPLAARLAAIPLLLIPLILLVVASQLRQPAERPLQDLPQPPPEADYYLRGAELSSMDDDGQLLYRVQAAGVLHYPDQSVRLDTVEVTYLNGPWTLTADAGFLPPGEQDLQLSGNVTMRGTLRTGEPVELRTPDILIAFEHKRIETDATVHMSSTAVEATATGLRTDLSGQELKLLNNVTVRYEP